MATKRGWAESLIVVGLSLNVRSFKHQSWSRTLSTFTSKAELGGLLDESRDYCWWNIGGLATAIALRLRNIEADVYEQAIC